MRLRAWKRAGVISMAGLGFYTLLNLLHTPRIPDKALRCGFELVAKKRRVLALSPHPGDLEFFAGGTMSLLKQAQCQITAVILSNGDKASNRLNIGQIRRREQEQAARVLGYDRLEFFELPDQHMQLEHIVQRIDQIWESVSPEIVLAASALQPWGLWRNRDHRLLGKAIHTVFKSKSQQGTELYLYAPRHANVSVDITDVIEDKIHAVMAHRSQMAGPDKWNNYWVKLYSRLGSRRVPAEYIERFLRIGGGG